MPKHAIDVVHQAGYKISARVELRGCMGVIQRVEILVSKGARPKSTDRLSRSVIMSQPQDWISSKRNAQLDEPDSPN